MPGMSINVTDASELAELLRFLADWIDSDAGRLGASLLAFVGHPAYGTVQLQAPVGRVLPAELTGRGRRELKVASAAVRRVEQDMLANLDVSEQDQMRRLLTACIASLTEPPDSSGPTTGSGHLAQAGTGLIARGC